MPEHMTEPIPGPVDTAIALGIVVILAAIVAMRNGWIRSLLEYVGLWRAK